MHATPARSSLDLCALFALILAGCATRPIDSDSDGEGTTTDTSSASDPSASSTATSTASGTGTATATATSSETDTWPTPECVYEDHFFSLTPEAYEHWLEHGAPPPEDTTTGGTGEGSTGDTTAGTTGEGSTGTTDGSSSTTGTTGTTDATGTGGGGGVWSFELCQAICAHEVGIGEWSITSCDKQGVDDLGDIVIKCVELVEACDGRRHACIRSRGARVGADPVGAWFARAAHDEAASVHAFLALGRELADHGAPAPLLARIRDAAGDEVRHARSTAALARRHGGRLRRPQRVPTAPRSLLEIARENAIEGCVRETWAALSAAHQARCASDPEIRAAMAEIADDEARHAELAWALDAWLRAQLDADAWAEVEAARRVAAEELVRWLAGDAREASLVDRAGVPDPTTATRLAAALAAALWPTTDMAGAAAA